MTWRYNEVVRSGNSTSRVKNFYANGLIVLTDIRGYFDVGMTIRGDDSNTELTLTTWNYGLEYDIGFEADPWSSIEDTAVTLDNGSYVALDAHFDGTPSQEYQVKNIVVLG